MKSSQRLGVTRSARRRSSGLALLVGMTALWGCDSESLVSSAVGPVEARTAAQRLTYGDHTYVISSTAKTWVDAQRTCADLGLGMATLNDAAEEQWLMAQVAPVATEWWIGINDRAQEGNWLWSESSSSYTHWNPGEPNDRVGAENCGLFLNARGGWHDAPCTVTRAFVCESAPVRNLQRNGHDYLFHAVRQPWAAARNLCLSQGFDLAHVDDASEDTWLKSQVAALGQTSFIGFTDQGHEGHWTWSDGAPTTYTNWRRSEPNNINGVEHCAVNNASTTSAALGGGWNDIPCTEYEPFICERDTTPEGYVYFDYAATGTASATLNTQDHEFHLEAGQTLEMGTCGLPTASATGDTYLRLFGPDGTEMMYSDDDCKGAGSRFRYRVPPCSGGTYTVRAGCYENTSCEGHVVFRVIPAPTTQP